MKKLFLFFFIFLNVFLLKAESQEVPFTLEDRERIIRLEQRFNTVDARFETVNQRFESMEKRFGERFESMEKRFDERFESIESKLQTINTMLYFLFGGIFSLIGFIFWDRRTFLKPFEDKVKDIEKKNIELEKNNSKLIDIIKERASSDKKFAAIIEAKGL